jgi:uncharacterized BrkB/YihY/UPF0761 family membrane protein
MLWMYITGLALLVGGAINSVLTDMSEKRIIDATDPVNPK